MTEKLQDVLESMYNKVDGFKGNTIGSGDLASIVGVRNQMINNYLHANRIEGYKNDGGWWRITKSDAKAWITTYITRQYSKDAD